MPVGIMSNVAAVLAGGLLGGTFGKHLTEDFKKSLTVVFGFSSIAIGIPLIAKVNILALVVLSLILGTAVGTLLSLEKRIRGFFSALYGRLNSTASSNTDAIDKFLVLLVLCCTSGTGIFGSMQEGFSGDFSVLLVKSILDFFTVFIFSATIGRFAAVIAFPQAVIFFSLFLGAKLLMPYMYPELMADFSCVGGVISIMTGFRILELKNILIINSLPALLFVIPIAFIWPF